LTKVVMKYEVWILTLGKNLINKVSMTLFYSRPNYERRAFFCTLGNFWKSFFLLSSEKKVAFCFLFNLRKLEKYFEFLTHIP
jgi:hypothetical protein